jgi:hypothetical protein
MLQNPCERWHRANPAFDEKKECVNAIVETPKGSQVKNYYCPKSGLFR